MTELKEKTNPFVIGRTHRDITVHLKKHGWSLARERGDHEIYTHPKSTNNVVIPKHKGDIAPGTVRDIMKKMQLTEEKPGLWANIHAKRERIKHGSGEHMRKPGSPGAPTAAAIKNLQKETESQSSDSIKPSSRFDASDSLVNIYKKETPGQSSTLKTIKRVVNEDKNGYKNPTGGLTQKGRDHYNRESGGHLKAPVTTPPSELKPGSKAANRRKSFCARMSGVEGPMKKPNGEPTRKALALRKWNC
jgi:predicted RNA binding protein YcfA (HicA-like mRNA interferase family)